jgi:hypothetical protein
MSKWDMGNRDEFTLCQYAYYPVPTIPCVEQQKLNKELAEGAEKNPD